VDQFWSGARTPNGLKAQYSSGFPKLDARYEVAVDDLEVLNGGCAPEVEEVLAGTAVSGATTLPAAEMGETVLDGDSLSKPLASL
jgi:hypothetical protein